MTGGVLYEDKSVRLDERGITIKRYYFPFGLSKRIPYRQIHAVRLLPLTALSGQWRLWGTSNPRYWFPLDAHRPKKEWLLVVDVGRWISPAITPDDAQKVEAILRTQGATC